MHHWETPDGIRGLLGRGIHDPDKFIVSDDLATYRYPFVKDTSKAVVHTRGIPEKMYHHLIDPMLMPESY